MADKLPHADQVIHQMTTEELRSLVQDTVHETFLVLGVDAHDAIEVQKDFRHLRDWRYNVEAVQRKGMLTVVAAIVTGVVALIWMGIRNSG